MSIIAAGTTTTTALSSTGNTDGTLQFQVNGTTASVTLNTLGAIGVGSSPSYGTSGQVLTSGGSTTAPTWTTNLSSQWTTTGSDIYYNTGNVGVGTSSPSQKLDATVSSSTEGSGLAVTNSLTGGYGSGVTFYSLRSDTSAKVAAGAVGMEGASSWNSNATTSSSMVFKTINANTLAERFRIGSAGQFGIGGATYGTSGQVLTSGGASAAPTWATASSGAIVYLSTTTASNSATVSVEDAFNVYDTYMLVITDLLPSNDNYGLNLTFKLGGTYQTSAFYNTTMTLATSATTSVFRYGGVNTTSVYLANAITNNATSGFRTVMYIPKPSSTASYKSVYGSCQYNNLTASNDSRAGNYGSIFTNSTAALTGLRFAMDAGNIASGTFRLYGISNS